MDTNDIQTISGTMKVFTEVPCYVVTGRVTHDGVERLVTISVPAVMGTPPPEAPEVGKQLVEEYIGRASRATDWEVTLGELLEGFTLWIQFFWRGEAHSQAVAVGGKVTISHSKILNPGGP